MYAEDLEWCWRAHENGWEIWFDPSAVVKHIHNVSGGRRYGKRQTRAHLRSSFDFYRGAHGFVPAVGWWSLNLAGAGVRWVESVKRGDKRRAQHWRRYATDLALSPFARIHSN